MCIAMLNDNLASVSITFHPQPTIGAGITSNGQAGPNRAMDGFRSSKHHESHLSSPLDKQCSPTLFIPISSASCGLGTAVLGGKLIALGECNLNALLHAPENMLKTIRNYLVTKFRIFILFSLCI